MVTRKLTFLLCILGIVAIFLPGYLKLEELKYRNSRLQAEIDKTKRSNLELVAEKGKLQKDKNYIEKVARDKMGVAKKGEIVYKITASDDKK